jgi:hypothetical protein
LLSCCHAAYLVFASSRHLQHATSSTSRVGGQHRLADPSECNRLCIRAILSTCLHASNGNQA